MNNFNSKLNTTVVLLVTQDMRNWLEENDVEHTIGPNLVRYRYSGCFGGRSNSSDYITEGKIITFEDPKERLQFELKFGESIKG